MARANRGDAGLINPYAKNLRRAPRVRMVMGAAVPFVWII